jgi:hypothetical protein
MSFANVTTLTSFGSAFAAAGHTWTTGLYQAASDADGFTNGEELGALRFNQSTYSSNFTTKKLFPRIFPSVDILSLFPKLLTGTNAGGLVSIWTMTSAPLSCLV